MKSETKLDELRSRSYRAGAMLALVVSLVLTVFSNPMRAADIVITVKGTLSPDSVDDLGLFGVGRSLKGQAFTLTVTFDASKAQLEGAKDCVSSSIKGSTAEGTPARAVLKVGTGSYVFGTKPYSKWDAWRNKPSACDPEGGISFNVYDSPYPQLTSLHMMLRPGFKKKLTTNPDWLSPISQQSAFEVEPFMITKPGDFQHMTSGRMAANSVSLSVGSAATTGKENKARAEDPNAEVVSASTSVMSEASPEPQGQSASPTPQAGGLKRTLKQMLSDLAKKKLSIPPISNPQ